MNLQTESVQIAIYDKHDVVATCAINALKSQLPTDEIELSVALLDQPRGSAVDRERTGLVLWSVTEEPEIRLVVEALGDIPKRCIRIVFLSPALANASQLFSEAGAQIVASELTSLESFLCSLAPKVPRQQSGSHPLTSGLVARLPWSELD